MPKNSETLTRQKWCEFSLKEITVVKFNHVDLAIFYLKVKSNNWQLLDLLFEENNVKSYFSFSYFNEQRKKYLKKENCFKLVLYCSTVHDKVYQLKVLTLVRLLFFIFLLSKIISIFSSMLLIVTSVFN